MISDFAVFLTIVIMVLLDYVVGVPSQKLKVPSKFQVQRFLEPDVQYCTSSVMSRELSPQSCLVVAHQR